MGGRIVVGIDGSPHARRALSWALDAARLRDAEVEAVHAYDEFPHWRMLELESQLDHARLERILDEHRRVTREAAERRAAADVAAVLGDAPGATEVGLTTTLVSSNHPAGTLIDKAAGADLLVVGARGRGGFTGLLLGSVSQHCARYAPCPVVIVRVDED